MQILFLPSWWILRVVTANCANARFELKTARTSMREHKPNPLPFSYYEHYDQCSLEENSTRSKCLFCFARSACNCATMLTHKQWRYRNKFRRGRQPAARAPRQAIPNGTQKLKFYLSILLWFTQKVHWPWLVWKYVFCWHTEWFGALHRHTSTERLPTPNLEFWKCARMR